MQNVPESELVKYLTDAGYSPQNLSVFLKQPPVKQRTMIEEYRCTLLNEMHSATHKLECLDYLRYKYLITSNQP